MAELPGALTVAIVVAGIAVFLLVVTICVVTYRIRNRRKPRTEKRVLRNVKLGTLYGPTGMKVMGAEEEERGGPYMNSGGIFVNPPGSAPYVDPTPNVKVIRQPNQDGKPAVFRSDVDRWGTHNVVHVDGVRNVSPPGSRTSWHQQYKTRHDVPETRDLFYRLYPQGNEENLRDYDYIPIKIQPGALGEAPSGSPHYPAGNHRLSGALSGGDTGLTVVSLTDSSASINGYNNGNDRELLINPSSLPRGQSYVHRGVEMRNKRQGMHLDDAGSETHSVVQNLSSGPDGLAEHRVSLNVVYE